MKKSVLRTGLAALTACSLAISHCPPAEAQPRTEGTKSYSLDELVREAEKTTIKVGPNDIPLIWIVGGIGATLGASMLALVAALIVNGQKAKPVASTTRVTTAPASTVTQTTTVAKPAGDSSGGSDPRPQLSTPAQPIVDPEQGRGDDEMPSGDLSKTVVNPLAKGVGPDEIEDLLPKGQTEGTHFVSAETVESLQLQKGSVLSFPPTLDFPNGGLIRVADIAPLDGETVRVTTQNASLADVVLETDGLVEVRGVPAMFLVDPRDGVAISGGESSPISAQGAPLAGHEEKVFEDGSKLVVERHGFFSGLGDTVSGAITGKVEEWIDAAKEKFLEQLPDKARDLIGDGNGGTASFTFHKNLLEYQDPDDPEKKKTYDIPYVQSATVDGQIDLESTLELNVSKPDSAGDIVKKVFDGENPTDLVKLEKAKMGLVTTASANADIEAKGAMVWKESYPIANVNLVTVFVIGVVPIYVRTEGNVDWDSGINADGAFRYNPSATEAVETSVEYKDGKLSTHFGRVAEKSQQDFTKLNFNGRSAANTSLTAALDVNLYELVGAKADSGLKLDYLGEFSKSDTGVVSGSCSLTLSNYYGVEPRVRGVASKRFAGGGPINVWDNLCNLRESSVEPPADPSNVVPRGEFRESLNTFEFDRADDPDHPISQAEMESLDFLYAVCDDCEGLQYAKNLTSLTVSGNRIPNLEELTRLEDIHLIGVTQIDWPTREEGDENYYTPFVELKNFLFEGDAAAIPAEYLIGPKLERIFIKAPQVTELPDVFNANLQVQELEILDTQIETLPQSLNNLRQLERLELKDNKNLRSLPTDWSGLENLESLNIHGSPYLTELPSGVSEATRLNYLQLVDVGIKTLPKSVEDLVRLKELRVEDVRGFNLDLNLAQLEDLESIWLVRNSLSEVPVAVSTAPKLWYLNVSENPIKKLPDFLLEMKERENSPLGKVDFGDTNVPDNDPVRKEFE